MLYYTGLLIAALYLGKLSDHIVEHSYFIKNSRGLSQDNEKWIVHALSVFALIIEAESAIHPPVKAELHVTHSRVNAQRRFFFIFVVCGLGYGLGRITERFYAFRFTLCAGLGRLHLSEHPNILATVMGDVAGTIEALLLKTQILQPVVDEPNDGELSDPIQKVRFGRLLVESIVCYFVWSFLPPTIQELVGPSVVFEKIALVTVYWTVSKRTLNVGDRVAGAAIESLF
ncbi:uncharacterized protein P174DRAFT_418858 [Aspergillus novofumigatus IBT 16806]|uniref:Uncharacterized protein n=1 Tax=Aspergillus novofumigatus (strain IBT 16806) TaxID=1392255 RepID=A0A2I1CB84_ASPN1|nr:uncharacterized protein P174DRAFT_418858 [Aspergillus novofumigatus IBT 16806]PKX94884.1 hypothetical protein P174DRAFT_418858 [Aspergillus novofumigatus IBT 16806]